MTTVNYNTANTLGINYNTATALNTTSAPDVPGPPFAPGTTTKGTNDSDYVYVLASGSIGLGDVCLISTTYTAAGITTTLGTFGSLVGVAPVAIASGSYGWLQRAGTCDGGIKVATACAPYVQLATTTTAGTIDDATTTGTKNINGIIITATNNAGSAAATAGMLNYPVVAATN